MEQEEGECFSFSLTPPLFGRKRGKNPGEGDSTAEAEKLCKKRSRAKREAVRKEKTCGKEKRECSRIFLRIPGVVFHVWGEGTCQ